MGIVYSIDFARIHASMQLGEVVEDVWWALLSNRGKIVDFNLNRNLIYL